MKVYKNLYTSELLKKRKNKILANMERGKYPPDLFVITLDPMEGQHPEIYSACMFYQTVLKNEDLILVGIASGYEDALFLLKDIVGEVYEKTKDVDLRTYIIDHNC